MWAHSFTLHQSYMSTRLKTASDFMTKSLNFTALVAYIFPTNKSQNTFSNKYMVSMGR